MKEATHIELFKETLLKTIFVLTIFFVSVSCDHRSKEYTEIQNDLIANERDTQFLISATELNLEEIQLGQLAQQKSVAKEIKELAKKMEKAHRTLLNSLSALAVKKLIIIPTSLPDHTKNVYQKLNKDSGVHFDKHYCTTIVNGHKNAIVLFEDACNESNDADIREWAITMLPVLRKQLEQAIACQETCEKVYGSKI